MGEEGETGRWADRHSPQGELVGGAGHRLPEVERGRREGGRRRKGVWFGIRGEGLANHHPVEEEEGVGSLTEMRRVDWLKPVRMFDDQVYNKNKHKQDNKNKKQKCVEALASLRGAPVRCGHPDLRLPALNVPCGVFL